MCRGFHSFLLTLMLGLWGVPAIAGEEAAHLYVPKVPADIDAVEMYLITGGIGSDLASRFGHTGLRIVDRTAGTDVVFNWGKFNFDEPGFAWKFFKGHITYSMGVRDYQRDLDIYRESGRVSWQDHLNLTPLQKRQLYSKIAWNAQPENRRFPYQYWYKNCSTIPRDYLDAVLEGQLKQKFADAPAGLSFRHYVRHNLQAMPFVVPLLDVFMNANIDRPISQWEDMFLPTRLRHYLLQMPRVDPAGRPIPGTKLLSDSQILVDNPEVYTAAVPDFFILAAFAWLPLLVAAALGVTSRRALAYRWFAVACMSWGLIAGLFGVTLLMNWFFSGHADGWHNINLMLFFPIDALFICLGWRLWKARGRIADSFPFHGAFNGAFHGAGKKFVIAHLLAETCWLVSALVGINTQDIWQVAFWFGAPMAVISGTLWRWGFQPTPTVSTRRKL